MNNLKSKSEIEKRIRAGLPLDHIPVIDFHCHLGASAEYYYIPRSRPAEVAAYMDRYGIDHIVTFPINTSSDVATGNRLQYAAAKEFPGRFSTLTMLHAAFPQDWLPLLKEGEKQGCRGIKLISQYQGVPEESIDWSPAFDFARDKNWVVLHHFWGPSERLARWAKAYPKLIFIEGHASIDYKKVIEKYDNVYQCTCACFVNWMCSLMVMVDNLPTEKILYGSDALDLDFGTGISPIALADIPEKTKESILGKNALDLAKRLKWNLKK
jgi:predicted TIM-barrel fold metal-dependent hydrolase